MLKTNQILPIYAIKRRWAFFLADASVKTLTLMLSHLW